MLTWVDEWGRTPLHWAVVNGHRSVVVWLLEMKANLAAKDGQGETALEIASRRAICSNAERPNGQGASVWGGIATLLGGDASTKHLKKLQVDKARS